MLVVVLLGMLASFLGMQMIAMLRTRQFLSSANQLYEMVKVGQIVAIGHETEVELRWSRESGQWVASLFCESDISLLRGYRAIELKGFSSLSLADSIENRVIMTNTGSFLPRTILRLEGPKKQQRYLDLRSPLPFTLTSTDQQA